MRKDSFWYGEYGKNNKIREEDLKMQVTDTQRVLIIEAEKEEWL